MSGGQQASNCGDSQIEVTGRFNAPGLPEFRYSVGKHGDFLARMLLQLSQRRFAESSLDTEDSVTRFGAPPLAALTTREQTDPTIAMLDTWSVVADILSFYQERIANEGYLRTATERRSVLELSRSIGYELNPGSSATAYLAFTVEDSPGSPGTVTVPAGTKIQSIPQKRELPQSFETSSEFVAHATWNALKPRLTHPQDLKGTQPSVLYVSQPDPDIKVGSNVLVVLDVSGKPTPGVRVVTNISYDSFSKLTRLDLQEGAPPTPPISPPLPPPLVFDFTKLLTRVVAYQTILGMTVRERDYRAYQKTYRISPSILARRAEYVRFEPVSPPVVKPPDKPKKAVISPPAVGLYAFKASCGVFGNTAPLWDTLASTLKVSVTDSGAHETPNKAIYRKNWEGNTIHQSGATTGNGADNNHDKIVDLPAGVIRLERVVSEAVLGTWVVVIPQEGLSMADIKRVGASSDQTVSDYALSGKSTIIELREFDDLDGSKALTAPSATFGFRSTTVLAGSRQIQLPQLPMTEDIGHGTDHEASQITLNSMVLGLQIGQPVIIEGEDAELRGTQATELLFIKDIVHADNLTTLYFTTAMVHRYVRTSATLTANVVPATHGETVAGEVLGSGDGTQVNQKFSLKKPPLAYTPAQTPTGAETTLSVRVNNVLWHEVPRLYAHAPGEKVFQVRLNDDGKVNVTFGDGISGARLPSGLENVTATYRTGGGSAGRVKAGLLTLLAQKPLGIRSVRNPMDAEGGVDPQTRDDARVAAPLTILTLQRVISRKDVEDLSRGFAGVGKAKAIELRRGESLWVLLTIAGVDGNPLSETSDTRIKLDASLRQFADPALNMKLDTFVPRLFAVGANLLIDPDRVRADVEDAVRAKLETVFSFAARDFGESVSLAEVTTVIQSVPGVIACQVTTLKRIGIIGEPELNVKLPSAKAVWTGKTPDPAELLLISPPNVTFGEMKP